MSLHLEDQLTFQSNNMLIVQEVKETKVVMEVGIIMLGTTLKAMELQHNQAIHM